jgi:hypothetical protein
VMGMGTKNLANYIDVRHPRNIATTRVVTMFLIINNTTFTIVSKVTLRRQKIATTRVVTMFCLLQNIITHALRVRSKMEK